MNLKIFHPADFLLTLLDNRHTLSTIRDIDFRKTSFSEFRTQSSFHYRSERNQNQFLQMEHGRNSFQ